MSSNIEIVRICEHCGNEFMARTTVTRFCGDRCAKRAYKQRLRDSKAEQSNKQTAAARAKPLKDVATLEYLNPSDAAKLLKCSRVYVYDLMDSGKLPFSQMSVKKRLIHRKDLDRYLDSLRQLQERKAVDPVQKPFDLNDGLTMQEAQEYFCISEKGLYDLINRHNIRKQKVGKYVFVERKGLAKVFSRSN